jgi:hypothetical protein
MDSFYRYLQFLLIKNVLTCEKQDLLFDQLKIYDKIINRTAEIDHTLPYLSLICQTFTLRLGHKSIADKTRVTIVTIWRQLIQRLSVSDATSDLTIETAALFLFLFHNLGLDKRKTILLDLANAINTSQHTQTLTYTRLLFLLDYVLRYFDEPSKQLLEIVDKRLLNGVTTSHTDVWRPSKLNWVQEMYENMVANVAKKVPDLVFFTLNDDDTRNKRLSHVAVSILSDKGSKFDYDLFYTRLIECISYCTPVSEEEFKVEYASISENFGLVWFLLDPFEQRGLPVSMHFVNEMATRLFDEVEMTTTKKKEDLREEEMWVDEFKVMQFLRILFESSSRSLLETSGGVSLKTICASILGSFANEASFFIKYWTHKCVSVRSIVLLNFQLSHLENTRKKEVVIQ